MEYRPCNGASIIKGLKEAKRRRRSACFRLLLIALAEPPTDEGLTIEEVEAELIAEGIDVEALRSRAVELIRKLKEDFPLT